MSCMQEQGWENLAKAEYSCTTTNAHFKITES